MKDHVFYSMLIVFAAAIMPVTGAAEETKPLVNSEFVYNDHGKRDPFWTLLGHRGAILNYDNDIQASEMSLEGIMVEPEGDSVAIINGNIVKLGDKVGFFIIREIRPNEVVLQKNKETITLKLKKEE